VKNPTDEKEHSREVRYARERSAESQSRFAWPVAFGGQFRLRRAKSRCTLERAQGAEEHQWTQGWLRQEVMLAGARKWCCFAGEIQNHALLVGANGCSPEQEALSETQGWLRGERAAERLRKHAQRCEEPSSVSRPNPRIRSPIRAGNYAAFSGRLKNPGFRIRSEMTLNRLSGQAQRDYCRLSRFFTISETLLIPSYLT